jgi:hypothetical protein
MAYRDTSLKQLAYYFQASGLSALGCAKARGWDSTVVLSDNTRKKIPTSLNNNIFDEWCFGWM